MDILIEFFIELLFEGTYEASKSKKVPKAIRYILIGIICIAFIFIIGIIAIMGVSMLKDNAAVGAFFIMLSIIFLILSIKKFREVYLNKNHKEETEE